MFSPSVQAFQETEGAVRERICEQAQFVEMELQKHKHKVKLDHTFYSEIKELLSLLPEDITKVNPASAQILENLCTCRTLLSTDQALFSALKSDSSTLPESVWHIPDTFQGLSRSFGVGPTDVCLSLMVKVISFLIIVCPVLGLGCTH